MTQKEFFEFKEMQRAVGSLLVDAMYNKDPSTAKRTQYIYKLHDLMDAYINKKIGINHVDAA